MTREEVMALSDEELQKEAALLHRFESVVTDVNGLRGYVPEDDEGRGEGWQNVPDYPNDWTAAGELWEKLKQHGWHLALRTGQKDTDGPITKQYSRCISMICIREDGSILGPLEHFSFKEPLVSPEPQEPRAITRAYVLAETR